MSNNQENNKSCELRKFERNNYFYGKLMTVRDFELEQQYINGKRWMINRLLFGSGTVCGLNVVQGNGMSLIIKAGIALDKCGHEIIVPEDVTMDLAKEDIPQPGGEVKKSVYLSYGESPRERVRAQTASTCEEICEYNRMQENYKLDIRNEVSNEPDEEFCGSNHTTKTGVYPSTNELIRFKRTTRKYVSTGDIFEVYLTIEATTTSQSNVLVSIEDLLPPALTVIDGNNNLGQFSIPAGGVIKRKYVVKVNQSPPERISVTAKININGTAFSDTTSVIEVHSQSEIPGILLDDMLNFWTKSCLTSDSSTGIKLAELSLRVDTQNIGELYIDNTKRDLVYNNSSIAQMLGCLRFMTDSLEDQSANIKEKIAPSNITLETSRTNIIANGQDTATITATVKNNAGVALPNIEVILISTLGSLSIRKSKTDGSGQVVSTLTSGKTPGIASVLATTGIGVTSADITFTSTTGTVTGTVTNGTNNAPIKGAIVAVGTLTTRTDDFGKYTLYDVPQGDQAVEVSADGFEKARTMVTVVATQTLTTDFKLTPVATTGSITGKVTDKAGTPIEGATVTAAGKSVTTDGKGVYTLPDVPTGRQTVTASAAKHKSASTSVDVKADGPTSGIDFSLEPATGAIKGRVTTAGGQIEPICLTGIPNKLTCTGGRPVVAFSSREISPLVCAAGGPRNIESICMTGGPGDIEPVCTAGVPRRINPSEVGIKGATVSIEGTSLSAVTDDTGNYTITDIPIGDYKVKVTAPEYNSDEKPVTVITDQTITVDFSLTPIVTTGTIAGKVTDTGGAPIRAATVTLVEGNISVITDPSGNYTITNVPVGAHTVTASAPGYKENSQQATVRANLTTTVDLQLEPVVTTGTLTGKVTTTEGTPICPVGRPNNDTCLVGRPDEPPICRIGGPSEPLLRRDLSAICMAGGPGGTASIEVGIKGATVSVEGTSFVAVTDDSGSYTITNIPEGRYNVTASAPGYIASKLPVTIVANQPTVTNFRLDRIPCQAGQPNTPCPTGQPNTPCQAGQPNTPCPTGQPNTPCPTGQPNTPCPTGQPNTPCPTGQPNTPCPEGQPNTPCTMGGPDNPCEEGTPRIPCSLGGPNKPCPAGRPDSEPIPRCVGTPRLVSKIANVKAKEKTLCPAGRPTIVPASEETSMETKEKASCPAGRPTISPKNATRPQVKAKGGGNQ